MTRFVVVATALGFLACGDDAGGDVDAGPSGDDDGAVIATDAAPGRSADYLFDLEQFHDFQIELAPADWQWLQDNARLEQYRPATMIFEGERYDNAALRFKGGYGTLTSCFDDADVQICPKLSLKVSFTKFGSGRFFGLRKLNFHSSVRDPSFMHEVLTYGMFREMGVPASRASHAKLTVNGEYLGVFVLVEQVNKEFIEDHWVGDTGNLYKSVWPLYSEAAPYIEGLRTNEAAPDVSRMIAFHQALEVATDENFVASMTGTLNPEYLARYLAVDRAVKNSDGIKGMYCYGAGSTDCSPSNYYWYEEPQGGIHLVPWDLDHTLGSINTDLGRKYADPNPDGCAPIPFCVYWQWDECDPDAEEVFLLPPQCDKLYGMMHRATWQSYIARLDELAKGPLSREVIVPKVAALRAKIRGAIVGDATGPGAEEFDTHNEWLDTVLEQQLVEVEALVAEQ